MRYELKIGLRYLFGRRKEQFISIISAVSVIGIATGVATLIIVIGVMSGFDTELRDRIIGANSHIVVDKLGGLDRAEAVMEDINSIDGVVAAAPFINTQGLLAGEKGIMSVVVRGINHNLQRRVTDIEKYIKQGKSELDGPRMIIGKTLAEQLLVNVGDEVRLISAARLREKALGKIKENIFLVSGIFSSDMYDYDSSIVFISLEQARVFTDNPILVSGISVKVNDVYKVDKIKRKIQHKLGFPFYARTWMDLNRNLFDALKLEKTAMFVILTLIVLVASFNIGSTLIMMVMEKTKDIGILKAMGASASSVRFIFTGIGVLIGLIGTTLGVLGGLLLAYVLKTYEFIKLPQDVYYINTLPVKIDTPDVLWIVAAALGISLCATFYPAYQASRLNPVEALRYE